MGRVFGIPVYVSPTWLLVAAFITFGFAPLVADRLPGIGGMRYLVAFAFAVLLYLSVFVHELSHSVVARGFGLPVRRITLYMLGGVSEIEREPQTPGREFLVAFAGPLLSLVLGVLGFLLYRTLPASTVMGLLAYELAIANTLVGIFNLLPGLPLDGGRMLRAGVWKLTRRPATATVVAAWAGRMLGALVFLLPFILAFWLGRPPNWLTVIWAALIGSFIWAGAGQTLRVAKLRERLPQLNARSLARRAIPVTADLPLAEAVRRAVEAQAGALVVVDHEGKPIALVNESAVTATPEQRRPWIAVGVLARTLDSGHILGADLAGQDLVMAMQEAPASEYLLVEPTGEIYGVLASSDVDRAFVGV
ncbi:MAG: site-2 protease family protein [Streptosporangiales bacterium]|nr:site-2 protease family protein [Streptosporangiales bacterium]